MHIRTKRLDFKYAIFALLLFKAHIVMADHDSKKTNLGKFELTSKQFVLSDPGTDIIYLKSSRPKNILDNCLTGDWSVILYERKSESLGYLIPGKFIVLHSKVKDEKNLKWKMISNSIGGDHGMLGVYDLTHFSNDKIIPKGFKWQHYNGVPADPDNLWYSYICELMQPLKPATVFLYGAVFSWDGPVQAYASYDDDKNVVGIQYIVTFD